MLGGPEFQRRMLATLDQKVVEETSNLLVAKDWPDFCERRGRVRLLIRLLDEARDIVKQMESA